MRLGRVLAQAQADLPECLAAGVLYAAAGVLVGVRRPGGTPADALSLADVFGPAFDRRGGTAADAAPAARPGGRGEAGARVAERVALSGEGVRVMLRGRRDLTFVAACGAEAGLRQVLAAARAAVKALEEAL